MAVKRKGRSSRSSRPSRRPKLRDTDVGMWTLDLDGQRVGEATTLRGIMIPGELALLGELPAATAQELRAARSNRLRDVDVGMWTLYLNGQLVGEATTLCGIMLLGERAVPGARAG